MKRTVVTQVVASKGLKLNVNAFGLLSVLLLGLIILGITT